MSPTNDQTVAGFTIQDRQALVNIASHWDGTALPYEVFAAFVGMFTSIVVDVGIYRTNPSTFKTEVLMYPRPAGEKQFIGKWYLPGRSTRRMDGKEYMPWPINACLRRLEQEVFGFELEGVKLAGIRFTFSEVRGLECCFVHVATIPQGATTDEDHWWAVEGIGDRPETIEAQLPRILLGAEAYENQRFITLP